VDTTSIRFPGKNQKHHRQRLLPSLSFPAALSHLFILSTILHLFFSFSGSKSGFCPLPSRQHCGSKGSLRPDERIAQPPAGCCAHRVHALTSLLVLFFWYVSRWWWAPKSRPPWKTAHCPDTHGTRKVAFTFYDDEAIGETPPQKKA
jgi:hypothetical protein